MTTATADSVRYKSIDPGYLEKIRSSTDYPLPDIPQPGFLERLLQWLGLDNISPFQLGLAWDLIFWLLVILLVGLLLWFVFRQEISGFLRKTRPTGSMPEHDLFDTGKPNAPPDPQALLQSEDYREAIRQLMQDTLLFLGREGCITLHRNKTNFDYRSEIQDQEQRRLFGRIGNLYAYAWYGGFCPDRAQVEAAIEDWKKLKATRKKEAA